MEGQQLDLEAVVHQHYPSVYRFAYSLVRNESEAADLTQDAFFILAKQKHQIRDPELIKSWLFTTLRREFLRKIRSRNAHPEVEFDPERHDQATVDSDTVRTLDARTILAAFNQIEPSFREPLELFYLGDLSYKEIASHLGIPIGTVMSRLSRAKEQLRMILGRAAELDAKKIMPLPKES